MSGERRPMPDDFREHAAGLSMNAGTKRWAVGFRALTRWYDEAGLTPASTIGGRTARPVPADFTAMANNLHLKALARHYGATDTLVARWILESGAVAAKHVANPVARKRFIRGIKPGGAPKAFDVVHRDMSRAGQAAEFLRHDAPIYRCDDNGRANPKGKSWRYGLVVLTDADVVARAARRGWSVDAWGVAA